MNLTEEPKQLSERRFQIRNVLNEREAERMKISEKLQTALDNFQSCRVAKLTAETPQTLKTFNEAEQQVAVLNEAETTCMADVTALEDALSEVDSSIRKKKEDHDIAQCQFAIDEVGPLLTKARKSAARELGKVVAFMSLRDGQAIADYGPDTIGRKLAFGDTAGIFMTTIDETRQKVLDKFEGVQ